MRKPSKHWRISLTVFLVVGAALCQAQSPGKGAALTSPAGLSTAVRFYWFGDMWSHWRQPMNFYTVGTNDKRLHTVLVGSPLHPEGVAAFVTTSEMQVLLNKLAQSDYDWNTSRKVERFHDPDPKVDADSFEITVVSLRGTTKGYIRLAVMCNELANFDTIMPTRRIRWQFQTMRWDNGCKIPGYVNEDVPTD